MSQWLWCHFIWLFICVGHLSRCFTRCIDWVQLLWSGSRGGEVFTCAQESSFEEAADAVARYVWAYFLLASFNWSVITPTISKSSKCKCGYYDFVVWTTEELHIEHISLDEELIHQFQKQRQIVPSSRALREMIHTIASTAWHRADIAVRWWIIVYL